MVDIKNNNDLVFHFNHIAEKVIESVSVEVVDILQSYILHDVYAVAQDVEERKWYVGGSQQPTYDFMNAFHFDEMEKSVNGIVKRLFYDWATMRLGTASIDDGGKRSGDYVHTQFGDFRPYMAAAFNIDGFVVGDIKDRKREPYWDNFLETLFASGAGGSLQMMFATELGKYGFRLM